MRKKSTIKDSQNDWHRLTQMRDEDIDVSEIPEVTAEQLGRARMRVGGKPLPQGKVRVSLALDAVVLAYFKAQAGGRGFQTLINEALKEKIRIRNLEAVLRRVIREELRAGK
ncbi:MAG: BrnA antitoxin family protein [bacterium]